MLTRHSALEGGFANPVFDAQATFRAVMDAMARPARIVALPCPVAPPGPLHKAAAAIACTLFDADAGFWLDAHLAGDSALNEWLVFNTGARPTPIAREAAFAIVSRPESMPKLDRFSLGTQEYPDRSSTVIIQLPDLEGGRPFTFEGPGIKRRATLAPKGLSRDFGDQWLENRGRFPRGVDLVLTAGERIACLPRSARLVNTEG